MEKEQSGKNISGNSLKGCMLALLLLSITACNVTNPLQAYLEVNLLPESHQSFLPAAADGIWRAYVYDPTQLAEPETGIAIDPTNPGDARAHFLVFEDPALGAGYTNAARLEMPNLMPNGDFEAALGAEWDAALFTGTFADGAAGVGYEINQNVLNVDSNATDDRADFALSNLTGGQPPHGSTLFVRYDIRSDGFPLNRLQLHNGASTDALQTLNASGLSAVAAPLAFPIDYFTGITEEDADIRSTFTISASSDPTPTMAMVGGLLDDQGTLLTGSIDNLRVGRADVRSYIRARVPALANEDLRIISGSYTFSFEVRRDPTADLDDAGKEPNRFPSTGISVELFAADSSASMNGKEITLDWDDLANWTEVSLNFGGFQVPAGLDDDEIAMEIRIYSNNPHNYERTSDVGSILIRNPKLELYQ
ncbi:MAG: hypothetical protein D6B26_03680 [Spirochaetaceae bacterium]|nr:MAG: hypothetical protein D6B26_03680 [Spirochaetaceae bacterium]